MALGKRHPSLFENGHILDVGANIGYTALVFSKLTSQGHNVYAFEPDPDNFARLVRFGGQASPSNPIECLNVAVGAQPGSIQFWHNANHHGDHRVCNAALKSQYEINPDDVCEVPLIALDNFCQERKIERRISFIKIDVQGFELDVCRGMSKILEENPTISVALEYMPSAFKDLGFAGSEVLDFMENRGFHPSLIKKDGRLIPTNRAGIEEQAARVGYVDILYTKIHAA
jgi:FkbM family methyltransferase